MRLLGTLIFAATLFCGTVSATPLTCEEIKTKIQPGDILYLGFKNKLFNNIARASSTWVAHTGLVLQDDAGNWVVYESKIPLSTRTDLCAFVARGLNGEVAAARWPGLKPSDLPILKTESERRLRIAYQQGFDYDSKLQFCSKFVHDIFAQVPGAPEIGYIETFQDVMDHAKQNLAPADYDEVKFLRHDF